MNVTCLTTGQHKHCVLRNMTEWALD